MDLVIVESPAKAKTINKYLGKDYHVLASFGHVRDLPPKDGSVDPDADFAMRWELSAEKTKQVNEIAREAKNANRIILATDPDREGEAISWHLLEMLKSKRAIPKGGVQRVTFNEITKTAILAAMAKPRDLDMPLIEAYLARRALDYLVGFTLSPVLWRKLPGAKSAGRVQSVALRLVCEREQEIERFITQEYWTLSAAMTSAGGDGFAARLTHLDGVKLEKFDLNTESSALAAKVAIESAPFTVAAVEQKPVARHPSPPFITSTLQQEAARKFGFAASHTMRLAQQLYEGISIGGETTGLITYMRTDGVQLAQEAVNAIRGVIGQDFGAAHLPDKPRVYTSKAKNAQEAHEAIRPTDVTRRPDDVAGLLAPDQAKLYALIWKRAVASQMASAKLERTTVELVQAQDRARLRAVGQVVVFPGFLSVYEEGVDDASDNEDERRLPRLSVGEAPQTGLITPAQHFTTPPPRYSEASLVKRMEELGIGRPSTYASILQTLRDRAYVRAEKNRFFPEEKGRLVTAFLENYFARYVQYDFTASLEEDLDHVSAGDRNWRDVLTAFWGEFKQRTTEVLEHKPSEVTLALDEFLAPLLFPPRADGSDVRACPSCAQGRLGLRTGKFGAFIGCSLYPECRYTRPFGGEEGAQQAAQAAGDGPKILGVDEETGDQISFRTGRFGPYVQRGEGDKPPRASLPKDVPVEMLDLAYALKLLSLPRLVGVHPETGSEIRASIGRFGPYLVHGGKYARLTSTQEVLTIGMNQAVAALADQAQRGPGRSAAAAPLKILGVHPDSGAEIKLLSGRYGPYVSDGKINANLPKDSAVEDVSLDQALGLLLERAARGPTGKGAKKAPAKKAPAKKAVAKKTPAKKPAAKKPATRKKADAADA